MINSNILDTWNKERIKYQIRYAKSCIEYHKDPENLDNKGHMHEQSWVLINVFGLSSKQVEEVEREGGFTYDDIDSPDFERWCRL
jgi:hypothetical protein